MFSDRNHTCCFTGHRIIEEQHLLLLPGLLEAALRNMKYLNIKILGFVMTRGSVDKSGYGKRYGKYKKGYGGYYSYGAPPAGDRMSSEPKQSGGKKLS